MKKHELLHMPNWIAGIQWFFFIFANIIVIPITVGEAFDLSQAATSSIIQFSFIITGIACIAQAYFGHGRPLLEGQSGLWWGIFLTLVTTASAQKMPLDVLGGSLALGVILSGILTILIGSLGFGSFFARLFKPGVMGVFILLLGFTLIQIFLKGMLGLPFKGDTEGAMIDLPVASLSIFIALLVMIISIKSPPKIKSYALLIGMVLGWFLHHLIFGTNVPAKEGGASYILFPLGSLKWDTGIVLTAMLAGLLNLTNTFGSIKGSDDFFKQKATNKQYNLSLSITGATNVASGFFGLVPYAPYVSSLGFLRQTGIYDRLPFIIGSGLFLLMGVIPPVGEFFTLLPLNIGSAVLFIAYLQLFLSSFDFLSQIKLNSTNVYRVGIPVFVGTIIMTFPPSYFSSLPIMLQPFLSNGLLVGIVLAVILENIVDWDKIV